MKAKAKNQIKNTNSLEELFSIATKVGYENFHNMNKETLKNNLIKFIG